MPDIFLYPTLIPITDIRLCDPTALCQASAILPAVAGKPRPVRRKRRPVEWAEVEALAKAMAGGAEPTPAWAIDDAAVVLLSLTEHL